MKTILKKKKIGNPYFILKLRFETQNKKDLNISTETDPLREREREREREIVKIS